MNRMVRKAAFLCALLFGLLGLLLPLAEKAHADSFSARVATDSLIIRAEPAARGAVVGSLSKGAVVSVSTESYGWAKVQSGKLTGWVAGHYLVKAGSTSDSKSGTTASKTSGKSDVSVANASGSTSGTVQADQLWLRSGPGTDSKALELVAKGTRLAIVKRQDGWLQVKTPQGNAGWVSARYVDESSDTAVAKTAYKEQTKDQAPTPKGGLKGKLIVIDPGHGGNDPGVIGGTYKTSEKTVNLKTAKYLAEELRSAGAKVVMTRTRDDEQPDLSDRAAVSNSKRADAFISVHYNASPKKVSGTLTYYYSESKDRPLARSIEARLGKGTGLKSNGISFGDYHVLRENNRPAVLLELGFLSDSGDEALVRKDDYQKKAAQAIVAGLKDYFGG
ncbi:N-acetylmuramoyl-L-alanine amidase [Paenibacillus hodogayensis]|uniref:N-acetylmuramoyl-L-alanine amidase n=1 Tax=Paenibacillus hodogayensis TaxID=279208 RepID=A0ABV5VZU4_9BACL